MNCRLVQLQKAPERCVALVQEPWLRVLARFQSVRALAQCAASSSTPLTALVRELATGPRLDYDPIYSGNSDWRLLPPVDHPDEPSRCMVSGTGLTHLGSAKNRQAMHNQNDSGLTDSMKMFRWGVEQGRPAPGHTGIAPEWFYKGVGHILRAHNEPLLVPSYAEDGGEEAEIAGVYIIGEDGRPWRVGLAPGNEFSDHKFEKKNYLNLAGSKLRTCSIGPEITIGASFQSVPGAVSISRAGRAFWTKEIATGEDQMSHSLANIEHHHFKFEAHRRPGDVHVHFFGAHSLSFGEGVHLQDGDIMSVEWTGFGRPLRNPVQVLPPAATPVTVQSFA